MSDEESDHIESEEQDEDESEPDSPGLETKNQPQPDKKEKAKSNPDGKASDNHNKDGKGKKTKDKQPKSPKRKQQANAVINVESGSEHGSNSDSSSAISQQATGISSGAPLTNGPTAKMTFDGGAALSDDEVNSWEDSVSESDGSVRGDNYYDEEDYDDEVSPSPRKEREEKKCEEEEEEEVDEESDNYGAEDEPGRLVMNVYCTEYEIIKKVARKGMNFKMREYAEDHDGGIRRDQHNQKLVKEWDVSWHDLSITPDFLAKLAPYQKVNHYPGMYSITRKNHLARNLMRMKRAFPEEFNFFPLTWVLPGDNIDFRNQFSKPPDGSKQKRQTYIVKPDGLSQGKGIFLSRRMQTILDGIESAKEEEGIGGWVVQHYMDTPHLVDDLKYDLRIYVLLYGCNPLRVYIHDEGLARFCTEPYKKPTARNMDNLFMHLTNYAINKLSSAYQAGEESSGDEESGHKRSLKAIMNILESMGADKDKLMREIKDIIVKTMATSQPYLQHLYASCQPNCMDNSMCFQILGFDIMIDKKFKPWLIEVNQSPSFATDSPLDYKVKKAVLTDTFRMLNCTIKKRKKLLKVQQQQMEARILTGKQSKMDPEEKARIRAKNLKKRFAYEEKRRGEWELIYPWPDEERNEVYGNFIKKAQEIWDEFTTGKGKRISMEDRRSQNTVGGAPNLNRTTTSKAVIGVKAAGALSNTGSTHNLRTGNKMSVQLNRTNGGQSSKDISSTVLNVAVAQGKTNATPIPPQTSSGFPAMPKIFSDRSKGNQQFKSIGQLEIIQQASFEGSPLMPKVLNSDASDEKIIIADPKAFRLNLQGPLTNPIKQQDNVLDSLRKLTMPSELNKMPVADIKQRELDLQKQTHQLMQEMGKTSTKLKKQHYQGYNNPINPDSPTMRPEVSNESRMSFMNRQIEAHERSHEQYDQIQHAQAVQNRDRMIYDNQQNKNTDQQRAYNNSHISMEHSADDDLGAMTPTRKAGKESLRRKREQAREMDVFTNTTKQPAQLYKKGSREHLNTHGSAQSRKSPLQSSEGRQSLQNAGSEQMNFLIATNYSAAKINLDSYKQQVPQWAIRDGLQGMDEQSLLNHYANMSKQGQNPGLFTWKNQVVGDSQSSSLQQAKMMQQKQSDMTYQAYENIKGRVSQPITPDLNNPNKGSDTPQQNKAMVLTEQKIMPQQQLYYDEGLTNRQMASAVKQQPLAKKEKTHDDRFDSQAMIHLQDSSEFSSSMGGPRVLGNTVGSTGFPYVGPISSVNDLGARSIKLPQKQAIKMTQMPIFLSDANGSHRLVSHKRETPKQKFKSLPGIQKQQEQVSKSLKHGIAPKTVGKTTSTKADSLGPSSRFEPNSVQVNKAGLKQKPSYGVSIVSSVPDEQYFQRRQANQQLQNEKSRTTKPVRMVQGGLTVSHQPLKHGPNIKNLQLLTQPTPAAANSSSIVHHQQNHSGAMGSTASGGGGGTEEPRGTLHHQNTTGQRRVEIQNGENTQQQTTTMKVARAGGNPAQVAAVSSNNLTPFQLYQQQQQLQQQQRLCVHQPSHPDRSSQQPKSQQQTGKGVVVGVVAGNGGPGAGGASHQQQNQFILQKNNNQLTQGIYQQVANQASNQQFMATNSKNQENHVYLTQQVPHQNQPGSTFQHQQRILQQPGQQPKRQGSSRAGNQSGSGSNNRRMGRALGQGKSVGLNNQKSRGQIGVGSGVSYQQIGIQNQFASRSGKQSLAMLSSNPQTQKKQGQSQAATTSNWKRSGDNGANLLQIGGPSLQAQQVGASQVTALPKHKTNTNSYGGGRRRITQNEYTDM